MERRPARRIAAEGLGRLGAAACLAGLGTLLLAAPPVSQGNGPRVVNGTAAPAVSPSSPAPAPSPALESAPVAEVKAAFVLNFVRFTTWPDRAFPDRQAAIVVGLVGRGEFSEAVETALRNRVAQGRPLAVRRLSERSPLDPPPHLIVFDGGAAARLPAMLLALGDAPVATVGDVPGFCTRGGLFNLFLEEEHVRFEVNTDAADGRGLKLSSSLLRLARRGPT
ncbi:MAG TPA: YfiR family protein, partial [Dongiaceae bacterium]|nr:YfiR family protein [Dongiaceae bacterium]